MPDIPVEFVIQGTTEEGSTFRPSDWAERLCGVMAAFGSDQHLTYSPYVHPISSNGVRCVVVDMRLESIEPMAYRFLLSFAKDNDLKVRPGRPPERTLLATLDRASGGVDRASGGVDRAGGGVDRASGGGHA